MESSKKNNKIMDNLEKENPWRILIDNFPCIAMILKKGTREIVASNLKAKEVGAVPGKTCYGTCVNRDVSCPWCLAPKLWEGNESQHLSEVEYEGRHYEGMWFSYNEELYVHYIFDITERKKSEKLLADSEAMMKSIFRAAPVGIGLVSNRIILQVNARMCEITGYSREELIGKNARILYLSDEDYEYVGREKYDQIKKKGTGTVETQYKCKDGKIIEVLLSSTPIDVKDLSLGVTFTVLDITEKNREKEKLRYFLKAVENSTDAIGMSTPEGRHFYQNEIFTELFGRDVKDTEGVSGPPSTIYSDEKVGREVFDAIMKGKEWIGEVQMLNKNGNNLDVFLRAYETKNEAGKIVGLVGVHTDITEQKKSEKLIRLKRDLAVQLSVITNLKGA